MGLTDRLRAPLVQSLVSGAERAPAGRSLFASVSHMCAFRSYRCSFCIARMAAAPLRPHRMENPAGPPPPYLSDPVECCMRQAGGCADSVLDARR